ncbi:MAG: TonB-dependent receptor plug domain-containing protein [candidate division Zixibacteria bacterium]
MNSSGGSGRITFSLLILWGIIFALSIDTIADESEEDSLAINQLTKDISSLPVRTLEDILLLQNGVVGVPSTGLNRDELHIRGARHTHFGYYLNGVPVRNELLGDLTATISPHVIGSMSLMTGGISAEYGNVNAGFVSIESPMGGETIGGMVESMSDNLGGGGYDRNWYTVSLNGPLTKSKNVRFWGLIERRFMADRSPSVMTEKFSPSGDKRLPNNWQNGWSYHGRIDYFPTSDIHVTATADIMQDEWQEYRPEFLLQPQHTPRYEDDNKSYSIKLSHCLNESTEYSVQGYRFVSERFCGDGVIYDDYASYYRTLDFMLNDTLRSVELANPYADIFLLFREGDTIFVGELYPDYSGTPVDTLLGFFPSYWEDFLRHKTTHTGLKGSFERHMNSWNTAKIGFEYNRYSVRYFNNLNATQDQESISTMHRINRYGYDVYGNEINELSYVNEMKKPLNLALYIENKIIIKNFYANLGIRTDYYDYNSYSMLDPERPFDPSGTDYHLLDEDDFYKTKSVTKISPRFMIGYSISEKLHPRFYYAIRYQRPEYGNLYLGLDFLWRRVLAGSYYPFVNPNLKSWKITERGLEITYYIRPEIMVKCLGYWNRFFNEIAYLHQAPAVPNVYDFVSNTDNSIHATSKGIDFSASIKVSWGFRINIGYSYSKLEGPKSFAKLTENVAWKNPASTPIQTILLDYDSRHNLNAIISLKTHNNEGLKIGNSQPFENSQLTVAIQYNSGTPYTPMLPYDAVGFTNIWIQPTDQMNSENKPSQYYIDMKLEKTFKLWDIEMTPFVLVKNLFSRENIVHVYSGTGEPNNTGYLSTDEGIERAEIDWIIDSSTGLTYGEEFVYRYNLKQRNPLNYGQPRIIYFGLRTSF